VVLVLGVPDLGERLLGARLGGLGKRVEHVAYLVPPVPLLAGLGQNLLDRGPDPRGIVADHEHRRGHAAALTAAEQIEPRLDRFAVPVVKRDEFLGAIRADPDRSAPGLSSRCNLMTQTARLSLNFCTAAVAPRRTEGRITQANRFRSPLAESVRLSLTRGDRTGTGPAAVITSKAPGGNPLGIATSRFDGHSLGRSSENPLGADSPVKPVRHCQAVATMETHGKSILIAWHHGEI